MGELAGKPPMVHGFVRTADLLDFHIRLLAVSCPAVLWYPVQMPLTREC
jgi:hypothetical protein